MEVMPSLYNGRMEPFVEVVDSLMNTLERLRNQIYEQQDVRAMADVAALKISITAADEGAMEVLGERIRQGQLDLLEYYRVLEVASEVGDWVATRQGHHAWMALAVRSLPKDLVFTNSLDSSSSATLGYHALDAWSNGVLTDAQVLPVLQRETGWWDLAVNRGLTRGDKDWFWRLERLLPLNPLGPQHAWCLGRVRGWALEEMDASAKDLWNMVATHHPEYTELLVHSLDLLAGMGLTSRDGSAFEELLTVTMGHAGAPMELRADHALGYDEVMP